MPTKKKAPSKAAPKRKTPAKKQSAAKRKAAPKAKAKTPAKKKPAAGKNLGGRPLTFGPAIIKVAEDYLENYKTKYKHAFPSIVGLCKIIKVRRSTIYEWAKNREKDPEGRFSDIVEQINDYQHFELMQGGVSNKLNPTITKLLLHKHGHSDKLETENTNLELSHEEWLNSLDEDEKEVAA